MAASGPILESIFRIPDLLKFLEDLIKRSRGTKRALLIELRGNIQLVDLYIEGEPPIDEIITRLETRHMESALESGFNFNTLKKGGLRQSAAGDVSQFAAYVGWSTEDLFSSIYLKIIELQRIVQIDTHNPNYRKSVRLHNIGKLMLLLLKHIRS
jgi:hypothetical protein